MASSAEVDWQFVCAVADHLQRTGRDSSGTDLAVLRQAVQCLHAPQRLSIALGLAAAGLDGGTDAASAVADAGTAVWQQRAVIVTTLVQQLIVMLLSSMRVRFRVHKTCAVFTATWHCQAYPGTASE